MSRLLCRCLALVLVAPAARSEGPRELTVYAAASLREAFAELGKAFERDHPQTKVVFSLAGSQELRTQIEHGAPADVFASADWKHMQALVAAKLASGPRNFVRNEPVVVVPKGNPAGLRTLADLPRAKRIVVGAPEVPIGAYTLQILDAASKRYGAAFGAAVEAHVVSREPNVRQVISKVALGEADAAIVYRTDALVSKGGVEVIAIPEDLNVVAEYPVAVLTHAKEAKLALEFVDLLLSPAGQETLGRFGFRPGIGG
ncbi:MAG TPA: molybdate ABC transporter substrate-binding protein [Myxococcales bacterium]|nr:molybdate ABC transporter substrate-binding protein [Myxococcales bacterium]